MKAEERARKFIHAWTDYGDPEAEDLAMELAEAIRQAEAAARAEEREKNCKLLCIHCLGDTPSIFCESAIPQWYHNLGKKEDGSPYTMRCEAHMIRDPRPSRNG